MRPKQPTTNNQQPTTDDRRTTNDLWIRCLRQSSFGRISHNFDVDVDSVRYYSAARTWKPVHYSYVDSWLTGGLTVVGIFVAFRSIFRAPLRS